MGAWNPSTRLLLAIVSCMALFGRVCVLVADCLYLELKLGG